MKNRHYTQNVRIQAIPSWVVAHSEAMPNLGNDVRGNLGHGTHMGVLPTSMIGSDRIASVITLRRRTP